MNLEQTQTCRLELRQQIVQAYRDWWLVVRRLRVVMGELREKEEDVRSLLRQANYRPKHYFPKRFFERSVVAFALLLLCGCAVPRNAETQRTQRSVIAQKLQAVRPVQTEARATAAPQPKQHWLVWDNTSELPVQFHATRNLRDWYVYGVAPAGSNFIPLATTNAMEFFRCRYVLPDGTYSEWNN